MGRKQEATNRATTPRPVAQSAERQQQIAWRAYDLYVARGYQQGHDLEDWLDAERAIADAA
jgi:Protein of unknown function (DUF2934)